LIGSKQTRRLWRRPSACFLIFPLLPCLALQLAAQDEKCVECHDIAGYKGSAHEALGCGSCHTQAGKFPHPENMARPSCSTCHVDEVNAFSHSVHAARKDASDNPTCQSCHGSVHAIVTAGDAASPVSKKNLPNTCGTCHANAQFLARHQIPFAHPVEAYKLSVHGKAIARGDEKAASCSDCHSSHAIQPGSDRRSKVSRQQVPSTCGACHTEIARTYAASVHGQAAARGVSSAPVCTDCHGEHSILAPSEPGSLVNPARVSSVTCGHCHGDERLASRFNLPAQNVKGYEDSFHGLAQRSGLKTVANCASCHGVHNILPSSDPRSTVNAANLAHTCGACHPGAGQKFAIGPVHTTPVSEHPVVKGIRIAYWVIIPVALGFMLLHNGLDFFSKLIRGSAPSAAEEYPRMNLNFRIAHGLVMLSFPVLVITGFALKFPESWWAVLVPQRGLVHRVAAVVLLASLFYHLGHLLTVCRDRVIMRLLLPAWQDLLDLKGMIRYRLGLTAERPQFGTFSYGEKIEYWAFIWGTLVMAASGFLLWFNNFSLRLFPKWLTDAATTLHYYEAILATSAIIVWHFYLVIFDPEVYPMDYAWLTGRTSAHPRKPAPEIQIERKD
jgi:cytochrome b subunit of formate dehydrogenase